MKPSASPSFSKDRLKMLSGWLEVPSPELLCACSRSFALPSDMLSPALIHLGPTALPFFQYF
jgi:hypothetical protein